MGADTLQDRAPTEVGKIVQAPVLSWAVAQRESPRTLSACVFEEGGDDPGYRFAQPGANVRAALSGCCLHAGGVKEISPR